MKTHAKEYLQEFASSQDIWLKDLIYDTTETNGNVTSKRRDEILDHLTTGTTLNSNEPNNHKNTPESKIQITKLTHKSGVNALQANQTIQFTKNIINIAKYLRRHNTTNCCRVKLY